MSLEADAWGRAFWARWLLAAVRDIGSYVRAKKRCSSARQLSLSGSEMALCEALTAQPDLEVLPALKLVVFEVLNVTKLVEMRVGGTHATVGMPVVCMYCPRPATMVQLQSLGTMNVMSDPVVALLQAVLSGQGESGFGTGVVMGLAHAVSGVVQVREYIQHRFHVP